MRSLLLLAGAAILAGSGPALAKQDGGQGQSAGKGQAAAHGPSARQGQSTRQPKSTARGKSATHQRTGSRAVLDSNNDGVPDYRQRRLADANQNGVPDYRERRMVDLNQNGVPDYRERVIDRDNDGIDDREELAGHRWGGAECPPGLAKKTPACVPPGQAKRLFHEGQRLPANYRYYTTYGDLPTTYPGLYGISPNYRYIQRDNYLYEVDPLTNLVRRAIGL